MMTGIHPYENRMFTHREVARIMGFPDDWYILPLRGERQLPFTWGKGILVQCGRWIASWVQAALDGNPSDHKGEQIGEREWLHDSTHAYRHLSPER
jgi:site-specific DNA-cytosine methylase